ncbi:alpha 1,2-mannosyltransferase 2.4.1 [Podila epigama]|nr:alpha 1,2-mannosyltransferase 2.4.1 [Podila epigama]
MTIARAEECDLRLLKYFRTGCPTYSIRNANGSDIVAGLPLRENAVIVVLCRERELDDIIRTIQILEQRFNHKYHYPYAFFNDISFSKHFVDTLSLHTPSKIEFDIIPKEHWSLPDWIDEDRMQSEMSKLKKQGVPYNSGFFFRQKLLEKYDYYWRIEPGVDFYCDMDDPFKTLRETGSVYGWVISVPEYQQSIPTLFRTVQEFMATHLHLIHPNSVLKKFMQTDEQGVPIQGFNGCHFWSNFEVGSLNFWRSEAYTTFFEYLDTTGGFFYERWGDAPVHSLALALFADASELHFFDEIGYWHEPFAHCPSDPRLRVERRCACDPVAAIDWEHKSCTRKLVDPALVGASLDNMNHRLQDAHSWRKKTGLFLPNGARLNAQRDGSIPASGLVRRLPEDRCWVV